MKTMTEADIADDLTETYVYQDEGCLHVRRVFHWVPLTRTARLGSTYGWHQTNYDLRVEADRVAYIARLMLEGV